jgi:hypothetical protein
VGRGALIHVGSVGSARSHGDLTAGGDHRRMCDLALWNEANAHNLVRNSRISKNLYLTLDPKNSASLWSSSKQTRSNSTGAFRVRRCH